MNRTRLALIYLFFDLIGSAAAWIFFCRAAGICSTIEYQSNEQFKDFFTKSSVIISLGWVLIYFITGFYSVSLKRSRLQEFFYSVTATIFGVVLIFLILVSNNFIPVNQNALNLVFILAGYQFLFTYPPRITITSFTAHRVHKGLIGYRTLIIGSNSKAYDIYRKIKEEKIPGGNILTGYVKINGGHEPEWNLKCLGHADRIIDVINKYKIEEVIVATEDDEFESMLNIIGNLQLTDVTIKAIPSLKDLLTGKIEHTSIYGTPLLEIPNRTITPTQAIIKQLFDYLGSIILIILLIPLSAILIIAIKLTDGGPVFYRQERIGRNGKPFKIFKFRSMFLDAEKEGPKLSGRNDPRITPVGRFMRKHRLDEIPNLINVLKGEMSFVGPRPERKYYIDQIVQKAPHFLRLLKVKPGITSWGQVKYGYASTVDQMIERLEYDLVYIDNMNLLVDFKIIIYTIIIIIEGKGM